MESNIIQKLLTLKNIQEKEDLLKVINQEKERLIELNDEDSMVRQAIIDFANIYNPLNYDWKNKTITDFAKKFINFYDNGKDIASPLIKIINDTFKEPSAFKVLISFENTKFPLNLQ